jgi:hypothetical protein
MDGPTTSDGHPPVAYFAEATPGAAALRLAAAVVWRGVPARAALQGGGGPLGWLRGARHRLWLRLGPLGDDVSVAGRPLFGGARGAPRRVCSVGEPPHAPASYDDAAHTLRVLGRVVPAPPPGRTVVALVDATGPRATAPRVVLRMVPTPTIPVPSSTPAPLRRPAAESSFVVSDHPSWLVALRADPVVRAFLDGTGAG